MRALRYTAAAMAVAIGVGAAAEPGGAINSGLGRPPVVVDRASPAATWRTFQALARSRTFGQASHFLDLSAVPAEEQLRVGPEVAAKLAALLAALRVPADAVVTEDPAGPRRGGAPLPTVVVTRFQRRGLSGAIDLRRVTDATSGEVAWLFSADTVSGVPFWHRVVVQGEAAQSASPINEGLGQLPVEVHRRTPREAVAGFLAAASEGDFVVAAHYLDLAGVAPDSQTREGARLARRLLLILQRKTWIDAGKVSDTPLGTPQIGVAESEEVLGRAEVRGETLEILLSRHADAALGQVWLFSRETVAAIGRLYEDLGYGWVGDNLPSLFFTVDFAGLQLWQWSALLLVLLLGAVVAVALARLASSVAARAAARSASPWDDLVASQARGPLAVMLWGICVALAAPLVGLTPSARLVTHMGWKSLALVGLFWLLFRLVDAYVAGARLRAGDAAAVSLGFLPVLQRVVKFVLFVLLVLGALDIVGVNVLAVTAGLGLGGIAVAFAAQKTLENLFGTLAIATDRPFKVGDFVDIGGAVGEVEDVGLRSTVIRTMARTTVTIPNSVVVTGPVVNYTARERFLYQPTFRLAVATASGTVEAILGEYRTLLASRPRLERGSSRCRLRGVGAAGLEIEAFAYVETTVFEEYLAVAEELNLAFMATVERHGARLAAVPEWSAERGVATSGRSPSARP
jgi:MscS family membrane protein